MTKINFGSGETKMDGFVNIDIEASTKPDLVCDVRKEKLPFEDGSVELIHMIHSLEHIERLFWPQIFFEFRRVLCEGGEIRLAYPEFEVCAKNFIENYRGKRDFWRATLYGRQLYAGDYHVVPMRTEEVVDLLEQFGFYEIRSAPEPIEKYNTFLTAKRGKTALLSRADVLKREIYIK